MSASNVDDYVKAQGRLEQARADRDNALYRTYLELGANGAAEALGISRQRLFRVLEVRGKPTRATLADKAARKVLGR